VTSTFRTLIEEGIRVIRARSGKTASRLLLGAGVLAVLLPALAGCEAGEHAPTLEFHPAAAGVNGTAENITASNAFVLGAPTGQTVPSGSSAGLFVSLYNNGNSGDTLLSATAKGAGSVSLSGGTVALPADAAPVNLTGPQPKIVLKNLTAPLSSGGSITVTLQFQNAGPMTLQVPVMSQAYYYSTFSPPAAGSSGGSVSPGSAATAPALGGSTGSPTPSVPATPTSSGSASSTPTSTP
jgi:copper(I)-binding protein